MANKTELLETDPAILELETESEFDSILQNEERVLVDFSADWCGPCQVMEEMVEAVAETVDATVVKVAIDAFPAVAARFTVTSIPSVIAFDGGAFGDRLVGMQDEESLRQLAA